VGRKDALYGLTDQLQQARSRDDVYTAALHAILTALPCDRAAILLFDETRTMRFVASREAHEARAVSSARAALESLESFQPQVALLDIGLPVMDGYSLARRIRGSSPFSGVKLIAITGYGQPADVSRASDAGFDAHLVKPVDFSLLRRTMERLAP
jgi:CheY-like chemotaxis protein